MEVTWVSARQARIWVPSRSPRVPWRKATSAWASRHRWASLVSLSQNSPRLVFWSIHTFYETWLSCCQELRLSAWLPWFISKKIVIFYVNTCVFLNICHIIGQLPWRWVQVPDWCGFVPGLHLPGGAGLPWWCDWSVPVLDCKQSHDRLK